MATPGIFYLPSGDTSSEGSDNELDSPLTPKAFEDYRNHSPPARMFSSAEAFAAMATARANATVDEETPLIPSPESEGIFRFEPDSSSRRMTGSRQYSVTGNLRRARRPSRHLLGTPMRHMSASSDVAVENLSTEAPAPSVSVETPAQPVADLGSHSEQSSDVPASIQPPARPAADATSSSGPSSQTPATVITSETLAQPVARPITHCERPWYDQFTSTDWVRDCIRDGERVRRLRQRRDFRGWLLMRADSVQGWILIALIGYIVAFIAYFVDVVESSIFDIKSGFCATTLSWNHHKCCSGDHQCPEWKSWSQLFTPSGADNVLIDYLAFITGVELFATISCLITLRSKTVVSAHVATTLDENLGALSRRPSNQGGRDDDTAHSPGHVPDVVPKSSITYYSAAGSGVAEVKVILSGFVLHGYLGLRTLSIKTVSLILSVASGMSLGKEGPLVHIATCVGNISCRLFEKFDENDSKRREILSAAAASGVAVAFGAPFAGLLFSLEEVSYYFPAKTLFRTFCCCIAAALSLKFFNPYGTGKIVLFQIDYVHGWHFFELIIFVVLGVSGGVLGAFFIKASRLWATTFRRMPMIQNSPLLEVVLVALVTGLTSFWNRYTNLPVTELLLELASPCTRNVTTGLCPAENDIPNVIRDLSVAFVIKGLLTIITFGIKVPAGIYVPSMVVGGLMGRIVGHLAQLFVLNYPNYFLLATCSKSGGIEGCVTPGLYALLAAGATMCGVTRLTITLAVILFELTGSLNHVVPFSIAIMFAKWTADAIEPLSIYDLLTEMNSYPFLDNKSTPVFDSELADILSPVSQSNVIDISNVVVIRAADLRVKLNKLQATGDFDGCIPVIRRGILVGVIPAQDLEIALDELDESENADDTMCRLVSAQVALHRRWTGFGEGNGVDAGAPPTDSFFRVAAEQEAIAHTVDLTRVIDRSPVALDIHSPTQLVHQLFLKLGFRSICALDEGKFAGIIQKKDFVRYVKDVEQESRDGGLKLLG